MKGAPKIRLDKLLANLGYGSRKEVQALIKRGEVALAGKPILEPEEHLTLSQELRKRLKVQGEPLDPLPGIVLLMHKPLGVTCSHKDEGELVYDLFPERWQKRNPPLSTVGRLDKDTSGLLLLTDDGELLHKLTSPKSHLLKRYVAELERPLRGDEHELFSSGTLLLEGEKKALLPAKLEVLGPQSAALSISEGRYHQVRRMFAAAGNHVVRLHRESIGGLELPKDLQPGEFRELEGSELESLFH